MLIGHNYTYITSLLSLHPLPPSHPSRSSESGGLGSLCYIATSWKWSHSVVPDSLRPHGLQPTRLLGPWDFLGMNTGVGCHFLLQWIFLTQGSNPGLPHWRQMLYCLSYQRSFFWFRSQVSNFLPAIYLTHDSVYMLMLLLPFVPVSFPVSTSVLFICLNSFPANSFINTIFLDSIS